MMENQWNSESDSNLSESFAQTDAFPPEERSESKRVSWLSLRCLGPSVRCIASIESLRDVSIGLRPLDWVMMNFGEANQED